MINLSSSSQIEVLEEENASIPDIDFITIKVDDVHETRQNVVITGFVGSSPRISQYDNPRGKIDEGCYNCSFPTKRKLETCGQ